MDEFDVDEQGIFRDKPHHSGSSGHADQGTTFNVCISVHMIACFILF